MKWDELLDYIQGEQLAELPYRRKRLDQRQQDISEKMNREFSGLDWLTSPDPYAAAYGSGEVSQYNDLDYATKERIHNELMDATVLNEKGQPKHFMGLEGGGGMTGGINWGSETVPGAWPEGGGITTNPSTTFDYGAGARSTNWEGEKITPQGLMEADPTLDKKAAEKLAAKQNKYVTTEQATADLLGATREFYRVMMGQEGLNSVQFKNAGANQSNSTIQQLPGIKLDPEQTQALAKRADDYFKDFAGVDVAINPTRRGTEILNAGDPTPEANKAIAKFAQQVGKDYGVKPNKGYNAARDDPYSWGSFEKDSAEFTQMMDTIERLPDSLVQSFDQGARQLADDWIQKGFSIMSPAGAPSDNMRKAMETIRSGGFNALKKGIKDGTIATIIAVPLLMQLMGGEEEI